MKKGLTYGSFTLDDRVYISKGELCRPFLPPLKVGKTICYWVEYLDGRVGLVYKKDMVKASKAAKILFKKDK